MSINFNGWYLHKAATGVLWGYQFTTLNLNHRLKHKSGRKSLNWAVKCVLTQEHMPHSLNKHHPLRCFLVWTPWEDAGSWPWQKPALCSTCVLRFFHFPRRLSLYPDFKGRDINSTPRALPVSYRGKAVQCGSHYLIGIPYYQRYFNDLRLVPSRSCC